jgi:hypothetical protein
MITRRKPGGDKDIYKRYGERAQSEMRNDPDAMSTFYDPVRERTMGNVADGDVKALLTILGGAAGQQRVDYNTPRDNPKFRFYNVTADDPSGIDVIQGQVYDDERGGYGGNMTLEAMFRRAEKDPVLADELAKYFGQAPSKAFSKKFNRDANYARLFVDVLGERGLLHDSNVIDPYTRDYRKGQEEIEKGQMPENTKGKGRKCLRTAAGTVCYTSEGDLLGSRANVGRADRAKKSWQ